VTVGLVPWNFLIAISLRKATAVLAAGCTVVVKPFPETPFHYSQFSSLAGKAGLGPGIFSAITTDLKNTPSVYGTLCKHPLVIEVTLTGSTSVGKLIPKQGPENLENATSELEGNLPVYFVRQYSSG